MFDLEALIANQRYNTVKDRIDYVLAILVLLLTIPAIVWGVLVGSGSFAVFYNAAARLTAVFLAVWWASMWLAERDADRHEQSVRAAIPMVLSFVLPELFFIWVLGMAVMIIHNEWPKALKSDLKKGVRRVISVARTAIQKIQEKRQEEELPVATRPSGGISGDASEELAAVSM